MRQDKRFTYRRASEAVVDGSLKTLSIQPRRVLVLFLVSLLSPVPLVLLGWAPAWPNTWLLLIQTFVAIMWTYIACYRLLVYALPGTVRRATLIGLLLGLVLSTAYMVFSVTNTVKLP